MGKERKELVLKAGKMDQSWDQGREYRRILEENSVRWMRRTREKTARIREEEKIERLEMIKRKRKKYLTKEETKDLKGRTTIILELAEMKQNLWRYYREELCGLLRGK